MPNKDNINDRNRNNNSTGGNTRIVYENSSRAAPVVYTIERTLKKVKLIRAAIPFVWASWLLVCFLCCVIFPDEYVTIAMGIFGGPIVLFALYLAVYWRFLYWWHNS